MTTKDTNLEDVRCRCKNDMMLSMRREYQLTLDITILIEAKNKGLEYIFSGCHVVTTTVCPHMDITFFFFFLKEAVAENGIYVYMKDLYDKVQIPS